MVGSRLVHAVDGIGRAPDLWWEGDVAWADDPADLDAAAVAMQPSHRSVASTSTMVPPAST